MQEVERSRMPEPRGVKGQGRPLYAGPWSNDGTREPDEVGADARGKTFCLLLGRLPKVSRRKGGTVNPYNANAAANAQSCCPTSAWVSLRSTHPTNQAVAVPSA